MLPDTVVLILILIVVQHWVVLPSWLFWSIIAGWLAKDMLMFPFVWRAYDLSRTGVAHSMIGLRGIAKERLAPSGYIQVGAELWRAEKLDAGPPIEKGEYVRVKKIAGLTLFVESD